MYSTNRVARLILDTPDSHDGEFSGLAFFVNRAASCCSLSDMITASSSYCQMLLVVDISKENEVSHSRSLIRDDYY